MWHEHTYAHMNKVRKLPYDDREKKWKEMKWELSSSSDSLILSSFSSFFFV